MTGNKRIQPLFKLDGKIAQVTGASKGIDEAVARGLAEFGASVVVSSRKHEAVDAVAEGFKADGLEVSGIAASMGTIENIHRLIDSTIENYGGLDIVINSAAVNPVFGPIHQTDERAFDKIMDVNLKGPFELSKKAYPILKQRGGGSIIHTSSIGGLTPEAGIGIYSVSKAAINNLTRAIAQDWGVDNNRVNAICPGLIKTKFSEALWSKENILNRFLQHITNQKTMGKFCKKFIGPLMFDVMRKIFRKHWPCSNAAFKFSQILLKVSPGVRRLSDFSLDHSGFSP